MALSQSIIWECRTTGASTNGGGFKSGASGTDWSQQDAAQYSVTDGVTAGTTTITSATANFGTDVVGNIIYVSGGTGSVTAARYEITGRTNSTTITVDRSTGLTAGTGVTLIIGGAADSPVTINSAVVAGNLVYIKYHASNKYNLASTLTLTSGTVASGICKPTVWIGYDSTRTLLNTDANQPVFSSNNNALSPCLSVGSYVNLRNVKVDGSGSTKAARGIHLSGSDLCCVDRCTVSVFTDCGILVSGNYCTNCYVTGGTSAASNGAYYVNTKGVINCVADNNAYYGFYLVGVTSMTIGCISINNTTANGHGFYCAGSNTSSNILGCVAYNNAGSGIYFAGSATTPGMIRNCILANNAAYGINSASGDNRSSSNLSGTPLFDYNAFYSNTSGARNNVDAGAHDVTLTGSPFTNAASGDFSLNNTASAGAACRAVGHPGAFLGASATGYPDIGAAQHQDAGGGGGLACNPVGGFIG